MKVFDGELGETGFNQVQFTFRCNRFKPEQTETQSMTLGKKTAAVHRQVKVEKEDNKPTK